MFSRVAKLLLPVIVLLIGAGSMVLLGQTEAETKKPDAAAKPPLVETQIVHRADHQVRVTGQGKVMASRSVDLSAAVAGRVAWRSEALSVGSRLAAGSTLLRIDPRDLAAQVTTSDENLKRAQLALSLEQSEQEVAQRAWTEIGGRKPASDQARRAPHLAHARAQLASAESQLEQAKRALSHAALRVPFNAAVQSVHAEVGQYVAPGQVIAHLVGTDTYWVQTSISIDDLPLISLSDGEGSRAEVSQTVREQESRREARILRLRSELSADSGMAQLLLAVDEPTKPNAGSETPLLLGSFVDVVIYGKVAPNLVEIPRTALHEGDTAYVLASDQTLAIRSLQIAHRYRDTVLVEAGLEEGDALIVSPIPTPVEGLKLRVRSEAPVAGDPSGGTAS